MAPSHAALAGAVLAAWLATPGLAAAESLGSQCRAACEARNVPESCRWLAAKPRRCVGHAVRGCKRLVRAGFPIACPVPEDLPGCLTNHACPLGSLCVDAVCQVVACGDGLPECGGTRTCEGGKCLVGACSGSTENCPAGFHCDGLCLPDDPGVAYCTSDAACIAAGAFDRVCRGGVCVSRGRRSPRRTTTTTVATTSTLPGGQTTTTTLTGGGHACFDVFDCGGAQACCSGQCVPDPYAGQGTCTELYTPACTLCTTDDDCACNGIFCDSCGGTASLSGCVDACASGLPGR